MRFLCAALITLLIMFELAEAGWLWGKRKDSYKEKCQYYRNHLLYKSFNFGNISPDTFYSWGKLVQECFRKGAIEDFESNKQYLEELLELADLKKCTNNNWNKFMAAKVEAASLQNALVYVQHHQDLFEKRCLEPHHQMLYRPPEGSTEDGGPWPTTRLG